MPLAYKTGRTWWLRILHLGVALLSKYRLKGLKNVIKTMSEKLLYSGCPFPSDFSKSHTGIKSGIWPDQKGVLKEILTKCCCLPHLPAHPWFEREVCVKPSALRGDPPTLSSGLGYALCLFMSNPFIDMSTLIPAYICESSLKTFTLGHIL